MSNKRAKAERSKAKDIRQGLVEQRPVSSHEQKKKKWIVKGKWIIGFLSNERPVVIGRYAKESDALKALAAAQKKSYFTDLVIEEI